MNGRSRQEYLQVIYSRYRQADLQEKQVILNQFGRNTGYNRKYVTFRMLRGVSGKSPTFACPRWADDGSHQLQPGQYVA